MTSADALRPYVVRVVFADGEVRDVDLEPMLWGQAFEPLRDPELFSQARVDPELETVAWPNGADLDPDVIYFGLSTATEPGPRVTVPGEPSPPAS